MKREHLSFTFESRGMLSLQTGFSFVRAAFVQFLREPPNLSHHLRNCSKVFESCYNFQLLPFYLFIISLVFSALYPFVMLCTFCQDFQEEMHYNGDNCVEHCYFGRKIIKLCYTAQLLLGHKGNLRP